MASLPYDPSRRIGKRDLGNGRYCLQLMLQMCLSLAVTALAAKSSVWAMQGSAWNFFVILLFGPVLYVIGLELGRSERYARNIAAWWCLSLGTGFLTGVLVWLTGADLVRMTVIILISIAGLGMAERCGLMQKLKARRKWALSFRLVVLVFWGSVLMSVITGLLIGGGLAFITTIVFSTPAAIWAGYTFGIGLSLDQTRLNAAKVTSALYADVVRQPLDAYRWRYHF